MPVWLALVATVAAVATPPAPTPASPARWVEDHAALMSEPARAALDARLQAYEHASGHQVVVWIGKSLDGAPLDDWAVRTFAAWKVGRAGLDDGVVMFVFADDHAIDIEVGYGLEDKIPDAIASRIIRDTMTPLLRAGHAEVAIEEGTNALLTAIEGHPWQGGATTTTPAPGVSLATWIVGGVVLLVLIVLFILHPGMMLGLLWATTRLIGRSATGGRFGGGGGRSGGGGARGNW